MHGVRLERRRTPSGTATGGSAPPRGDFAPNTNVLEHAGRTLALVEAGAPPYELTDELDTVGPLRLRRHLRRRLHRPPARGPGDRRAARRLLQLDPRQPRRLLGARRRRAGSAQQVEIEVHGSPMIHDCALTEHYVGDLRPAGHLRHRHGRRHDAAAAAAAGQAGAGPGDRPQPAARPGRRRDGPRRRRPHAAALLVGRRLPGPDRAAAARRHASADVRWFDIDPCYVFHTLNAFEEPATATW